ncbi:dynein regulatory complex subunit 4-like [Oncorhynchus clarkii lewisi]|uniref:dynein regulatory complex subunit 4-like n=1 Tax=Oncorhynchus clarkii lewisi TaxID=490388 RepID=UPI0039B97FB1
MTLILDFVALQPPKKKVAAKSAKGKTPTVVDGLSMEEMSKEQLEEHIVRLREEMDREREERNYFQMERDKIHTFWKITKRHLDERKADLRNRDREMKEAEERHQVEIKVYKQKVKHLLYEHQNSISELKGEGVVSNKLMQKEHAELENALCKGMRTLKVDIKTSYAIRSFKEQELSNENLIKGLKLVHGVLALSEMKRKEERLEKDMAEVLLQNKRLTEPLQGAKEEVTELQKQLANYEKDKTSLAGAKARLKVADKEMKDLTWEHEVLEQRFSKVQVELDDLYKKFTQAIQEVQQKSGFMNLLLERELGALTNTLEKKEAQLNALVVVTRKLEEVVDSKNIAIMDLQYELARVCKAHNDLLRTYEAKLHAFGIPMEELGFKPLESSVAGHSLGQGPAGLVSAPT